LHLLPAPSSQVSAILIGSLVSPQFPYKLQIFENLYILRQLFTAGNFHCEQLFTMGVSDVDAQDDEPEEIVVDSTVCKCGQKHGSKSFPNPRFTKDELMRLGMVLVDNLGFAETASI
jgi:hypothetical protein